jgi:ASC-1-like (ASCH) protein
MRKKRIIRASFRGADRNIFQAIKNGYKKIETRAATKKYKTIEAGDVFRFVCGDEILDKVIIGVTHFNSIAELVKKYKPKDINPGSHSVEDLQKMYDSFTGYTEDIPKYGIMAFELSDE